MGQDGKIRQGTHAPLKGVQDDVGAPVAQPGQVPAEAMQPSPFEQLLAADRRAERRLAWMDLLCLLLATGGVLLGRYLMERL